MGQPIDRALLAELYRQAHAARWQLSVDEFGRALEASAAKALSGQSASPRELKRYLQSLRLEDLALACACAAGREEAWDHFVLQYRPILYRAAEALAAAGDARELADSLYADLFGLHGASSERRSLFVYFHGRSSLATWLRAVLAQRRVDLARTHARTAPLPDEELAAPAPLSPDPDRTRHLTLMQEALRDAMAKLDPRDRLRLRYYYAQDLTLAETGRLLREHEASVSRHLSAARKALRRDIERSLRHAGLDRDEIARCFESVSEDAGPLDLDSMLDGTSSARNSGPDVQSTEASTAAGRILANEEGRMRR